MGIVVPLEQALVSLCLNQGGELCDGDGGKQTVSVYSTQHIQQNLSRMPQPCVPPMPILPSPSVSPAVRKALVSASFRARAPALKFCRNNLQTDRQCGWGAG